MNGNEFINGKSIGSIFLANQMFPWDARNLIKRMHKCLKLKFLEKNKRNL